jgi:hypothetical protein
VKGAFPFVFLLLRRAYAGGGRSSTSKPASPAFCQVSVTAPGVGIIRTRMARARKKSGAQVGAPDKSDQLSTAGGPSQGEVPGREHGYRRRSSPEK